MSRVVVVGTGTDVGKTHVSCALLRALRERGARVGGWKPIASGISAAPGDAEAIAEAAGTPVVSPLHAFVPPISAHLAARRAGVTIDVAAIAARATALQAGADVLVIETAGGLFSPLGKAVSNADLVQRLAPALVLLVAPDRLGVLHDVQATLLAARARGIVVDAIALSTPGVADASTGTNAGELQEVYARVVAATFPRAPWAENASLAAAGAVLAALAI